MYDPHEFERLQKNIPRQADACSRIIEFVFSRGRPQQFPRFVYWLGKENGGEGWEDSYQNALVAGTRLFPHFIELGKPEITEELRWYDFVIDYQYIVDNSVWRFITHEWRMSAYKNRFTMLNAEVTVPQLGASVDKPETYFSTEFFRTAGFEPKDAR